MKRIKALIVGLMACVTLAVAAPPALAHYGDWWTQYQVTQRQSCAEGFCGYETSEPYGDHSRVFTYVKYLQRPGEQRYRCPRYFYIGHTYSVWYVDRTPLCLPG